MAGVFKEFTAEDAPVLDPSFGKVALTLSGLDKDDRMLLAYFDASVQEESIFLP